MWRDVKSCQQWIFYIMRFIAANGVNGSVQMIRTNLCNNIEIFSNFEGNFDVNYP